MIFPISDEEASFLYDIGWSSGYGYQDEWDWWQNNTPASDQMNSRCLDSTKMKLTEHLIALRTFQENARKACKHYIQTNK